MCLLALCIHTDTKCNIHTQYDNVPRFLKRLNVDLLFIAKKKFFEIYSGVHQQKNTKFELCSEH